MGYTRRSISFVILTILVGLGSLVLSTEPVRAQFACEITITKEADPADDTPFEFEILPSGQNFTLMDPSQQSFTFFLNGNDTVRVTELPTEGFVLTDINCTTEDEENVIIILNQRAVRITCVSPGPSFDCTFVNSEITGVPTLSEWGLIAMAGILGIVGFMVIRRRKVAA